MIRSLARLTAAALIIASAAAFAVGVSLEFRAEAAGRLAERPVATGPTEAPTASGSAGAGQDPGAGHESGQADPAAEAQEHTELLPGVNLESADLVAAAIAVSVLSAIAILALGMPWLAGVIVAAMLAFAALDIREIILQAGRERPGLAATATAAAVLHLLAALAAARVARSGPAHRNRAAANRP